MIRDLPVLLRWFWGELISRRGWMLLRGARVLLALLSGCLYLFSPFDFIPEAVFGVRMIEGV